MAKQARPWFSFALPVRMLKGKRLIQTLPSSHAGARQMQVALLPTSSRQGEAIVPTRLTVWRALVPTSEPCTLASLPSGWSYWWDQPVLPGLEGALWLLVGTVGLGGFMFISLSAQQFSWACTGLVGAGVVGKP